ncbi:hypothetical protein OF846_001467 [Rhodotorula toruloides]|nr:hypothetical protein OF846_001467 [Rhodotorula toruloides]
MAAPPGRCFVCDNTSAKACSGCGWLFVCSRAHQAVLWPTHKYFCRTSPPSRSLPAFTLPPLKPEEAEIYRLHPDGHVLHGREPEPPFEMVPWYKSFVKAGWVTYRGPEDARWILDDLQKPAGSAETPEPARTFILIALKGQHFEQRIELDSDAWDLCSRDLTRILDRLRPHFRSKGMALPNDLLTRLAPFFHQDLIFNTIGINYQGKDRQELLNLAALRMEDWVVKDCEEEEEVKRCLAAWQPFYS